MVLATGHGLELDWWCFGILLLLALKTLNVIYLVVLHVLYDITQYIYTHTIYDFLCSFGTWNVNNCEALGPNSPTHPAKSGRDKGSPRRFELMSGKPPFESSNPMQIYVSILHGISKAGIWFPYVHACMHGWMDRWMILLSRLVPYGVALYSILFHSTLLYCIVLYCILCFIISVCMHVYMRAYTCIRQTHR